MSFNNFHLINEIYVLFNKEIIDERIKVLNFDMNLIHEDSFVKALKFIFNLFSPDKTSKKDFNTYIDRKITKDKQLKQIVNKPIMMTSELVFHQSHLLNFSSFIAVKLQNKKSK